MSIQIRAVHGDALTVPADLLVLKYAQGFYGVDHEAALRLGVQGEVSPGPGASALVPGNRLVAAGAVLFLGVPHLGRFDYAEIRTFGRRAVAEAAAMLPAAAEIAL